jgi:thiamine kinase-like enzyme
MQDRTHHQREVRAFLQNHISIQSWEFTLPKGTGNETYFARGGGQACFIKLGVQTARYQAMGALGLTPQVLASGELKDGTSIIVQPFISGRAPSRTDFHANLGQFASVIKKTHNNPEVKQTLPKARSDDFRAAGLEALSNIRQRWEIYRGLVPEVAGFVDESLDRLDQQVRDFQGEGLAASHNDICNMNWLITPDGQIYLLDLESMSQDDPAFDIGALLWWYYPPRLRDAFLEFSGYAQDPGFTQRMQVRMAMHCLSIELPREESFDEFDPALFPDYLVDFRAVLAGEENPQGYTD